jgi:hypothetical protein
MASPLGLSTNHDLAPPRDTGSPDFEFLLNSKGTDGLTAKDVCH